MTFNEALTYVRKNRPVLPACVLMHAYSIGAVASAHADAHLRGCLCVFVEIDVLELASAHGTL